MKATKKHKNQHLFSVVLFVLFSGFLVPLCGYAQTDFSKFQHTNPNHSRLPCLLCHRRTDNSATPQMPGKPNHLPCTGCHQQQFANSSSPICTICHTNVQAGTVKAFPPLRSFDMRFSHAQHSSNACNTCHSPSRGGVALSIPSRTSAHNTCFSCHKPDAQANGKNISSCGTCHQPGTFRRTPEFARGFRVGFSHAKHDSSEGLRCNDCHRARAGLSPMSAPAPLNHHAPARASSCMTCHNGKRAFGGDDFTTCVKCHRGDSWRF